MAGRVNANGSHESVDGLADAQAKTQRQQAKHRLALDAHDKRIGELEAKVAELEQLVGRLVDGPALLDAAPLGDAGSGDPWGGSE